MKLTSTTATLLLFYKVAECCTNLLVTPGASEDGSSIIAYNADSPALMGMLYHYPPVQELREEEQEELRLSEKLFREQEQKNSVQQQRYLRDQYSFTDNNSEMKRKVYDWDSGNYLGEIPEVKETHNVVGNVNECGLTIAETTFGGVQVLANQQGAKIDYGSLIWITLQRACTARDAIKTMVQLMDTHGYASEGESFSIADLKEVWVMEVIGRGNNKANRLGAVWVAQRVPDGFVGAHSNQARITTFPRKDPDNCMFADDVVDIAREFNLFDGIDEDFSFSDTYDPVNFHGVRYGEARTWSLFSKISQDTSFQSKYLSYINGTDLTNRMPLWVKPKSKISLSNVMDLMRDHYEGTELETSTDVGGGPFQAPYRNTPIQWELDGKSFFNERTVGTSKTGWNFVAQQRDWVPKHLSSLMWFATDDSATAPRHPVYGCSRSVSSAFYGKGPQDGVPSPILDFDMKKAFWIQNMVSNFAYTRWKDIYPILSSEIRTIEKRFIDDIKEVDTAASSLNLSASIAFVTHYSTASGDSVHQRWLELYGELFARFRDGFVITRNEDKPGCGCDVAQPGYDKEWYEKIVKETGDRYMFPEEDLPVTRSKLDIV